MAITQCVTNQYKQDVMSGIHQAADVYKIALFPSTATLNASTTAYSSTEELASGSGYTQGGVTLSGFTVTLSGSTAVLDWTTDPSWANASFGPVRGALIYNSSRSNKAVAVFDFGSDKTGGGGTFTAVLPVADSSTGLIRLA